VLSARADLLCAAAPSSGVTLRPFSSKLLIVDRSFTVPGADDALYSAVYDELKSVARRHLRVRAANATINTTELVHEAFLKLGPSSPHGWDDRAHFFGAASRAMRQVLVDFARRRSAAKRGGSWRAVTLCDGDLSLELEVNRILELDNALRQLDAVDQRLRQVVELRFFGGMAEQDIARMLGVSARTVERDWLKARLFLLHELDAKKPLHGS
jgi:RNA polymerase sigma factor (TIGR02999 family)